MWCYAQDGLITDASSSCISVSKFHFKGFWEAFLSVDAAHSRLTPSVCKQREEYP